MNRTPRTDAFSTNDAAGMNTDEQLGGPSTSPAVQWESGTEVPPFISSNPGAVALLVELAAGQVDPPPGLRVTNSVAVQIWRLIFDGKAKATELKCVGRCGLYTILGSLSLGVRPIEDDAAVKRLETFMGRRGGSNSGLAPTFKEEIKKRDRNPRMAGMSLEEAEQHLHILWDSELLDFAFQPKQVATVDEGGVCAGGGGGGDDPNDPATAGQTDSAAPRANDYNVALDIRTRCLEAQLQLRALAAASERRRHGLQLSVWHLCGGQLPDDALRLIDARVRAAKKVGARREETYELQAIRLREQVDEERRRIATLEAEVHKHQRNSVRGMRMLDRARSKFEAKLHAANEERQALQEQHKSDVKEQRRAAIIRYRALQKDMQESTAIALEATTRLESDITNLEGQLRRAKAALRLGNKEKEATRQEAEELLRRAQEARSWARVKEEEARRKRAEDERSAAQYEVARLAEELAGRQQRVAAEKQELYYLRYRVKELQTKVSTYDARSNLKFFEVEPLTESVELLRQELEAQKAATAKYKAIAEPDRTYFQKGGFTLAVDLAVAECMCKALVSRNQVPLLFIIFARFFQITIPTHKMMVPHKKIEGKMTYIERALTYLPGKTHVKEVAATLNQAHKLQMGVQLLESAEGYAYISDGAESLQSEYLSQLLSKRDANGKVIITSHTLLCDFNISL